GGNWEEAIALDPNSQSKAHSPPDTAQHQPVHKAATRRSKPGRSTAPLAVVAVDVKSGEPVMRLHDRHLLERLSAEHFIRDGPRPQHLSSFPMLATSQRTGGARGMGLRAGASAGRGGGVEIF